MVLLKRRRRVPVSVVNFRVTLAVETPVSPSVLQNRLSSSSWRPVHPSSGLPDSPASLGSGFVCNSGDSAPGTSVDLAEIRHCFFD